jgi:uncharacterized protein YcbK (DUF882 family)
MQGWTQNVTDAANGELRRVRKELGRASSAPLRITIAGDPTKRVLTFTIPRRFTKTFAAATALAAVAAFLVGWRPAAPPGALSFSDSMRFVAVADVRSAPLPPIETAPAAKPADDKPHSEPSSTAPAEPRRAQAEPKVTSDPEHFTVEIANTGKVFDVRLGGPASEPDEESYRTLRHELRCQRTGAENPIDPRLVELLHQIANRTGARIQVVSAFRAPLYPRDLNYHVRGMAADIRVPGLSTAELRDLARSLGATGVGYYPTVHFVHIDVRETPYFWTDTSGHNEPRHDVTSGSEGAPAPETSSIPSSGTSSKGPELGLTEEAPLSPDLLPSTSAPLRLPVRTPGQSAADSLGLGSGVR